MVDRAAEELYELAHTAAASAYAPYSQFSVGAALRCADGTIVLGCNVENASYGLTMCAERVAIATAVAQGHRRFTALAIAQAKGWDLTPCGACRQVLAEFSHDLAVYHLCGAVLTESSIADLLPQSFRL